jgi:hypothetical protein
MEILPNLYDAMVQLRQTHPGEIWIDAVCINQDDPKEKNVQVTMMGRIYASAESVIVWLGTCPTVLSPCIEQLETFLMVHSAEKPESTNSDNRPSPMPESSKGDDWVTILGVLHLLTRRWFRRIWVLQEACLANEIIFLLGNHQIHP